MVGIAGLCWFPHGLPILLMALGSLIPVGFAAAVILAPEDGAFSIDETLAVSEFAFEFAALPFSLV